MSAAVSNHPHTLVQSAAITRRTGWPLERVLFPLAGSVTLLAAGLSAFVSPWFLALNALVGINQWVFTLFGACPASLVLERVFGLQSVIFPQRQWVGHRRSGEHLRPTPSPLRSARSTVPKP